MRDASLLAAKFFRDLAEIFDGKTQAAGKCTFYHARRIHVAEADAPTKLISRSRPVSAAAVPKGAVTDDFAEPKARGSSKDAATKSSSKGQKDDGAAEPTKKKKKEKNETGIKKPLSAFMLFTNHRRPIVRDEYPGKFKTRLTTFAVELKLVELSKIIGAEWQKLSETQRQPWSEKASDLQLQYKIDVFNSKQKDGHAAKGSPAKEATKKKSSKVGEKRSSPENPTAGVNGAAASKAQKVAETGERKQ